MTLRGATSTSVFAIGSALTGHQLTLTTWSIDFTDAFDIYSQEMACGVNAAGGAAFAHYCDPTADNLVNQAEGLPLGPARDALLVQAQQRILHAGARVPLVYLKIIDIVSPKVGGFYYQPAFGWQYENYWLAH